METEMSQALSIIEGAYFKDILDQPRALAETLKGLEPQPRLEELGSRLKSGTLARLVLTGMGSSCHALHPLNVELLDRGLSPMLIETSELIHYGLKLLDPSTLVVAVSQSGRSAEIVRLLELNAKRASVIAVFMSRISAKYGKYACSVTAPWEWISSPIMPAASPPWTVKRKPRVDRGKS